MSSRPPRILPLGRCCRLQRKRWKPKAHSMLIPRQKMREAEVLWIWGWTAQGWKRSLRHAREMWVSFPVETPPLDHLQSPASWSRPQVLPSPSAAVFPVPYCSNRSLPFLLFPKLCPDIALQINTDMFAVTCAQELKNTVAPETLSCRFQTLRGKRCCLLNVMFG